MGIRHCTRADYFSRWHMKHQKFFGLPQDPLEAKSFSWPPVTNALRREPRRWLILGSILQEEHLYDRFTSFLRTNGDDTVMIFFPPYAPRHQTAFLYEFDADTRWGEVSDPEAEHPLSFAEGLYFHMVGASGSWASYFYERRDEYLFVSDASSCLDVAHDRIPLRSLRDTGVPETATKEERDLYK